MAKTKTQFECTNCGHVSSKWLGNCPSCNEWHTFEEVKKVSESNQAQHKAKVQGLASDAKPLTLDSIEGSAQRRVTTDINELDRVLGGGILPGAFILIGGDPGVGKSTLTLQIAKSKPDLKILYCAGEESASQIKQRAERLGVVSKNLSIYSETRVDLVLETAQKENPDILIIDSIQTLYRTELQSMPGSIQQVKECAALLQQLAKKKELATIIIGHVTKEGDLAGPRVLEHMVDTVLQFEGDKHYTYRLLRTVKNRFGAAQEVGIFEMHETGLREVSNPSEFFVSGGSNNVSGSAIACTIEGSRPMLIEIQALVSPASYGTPQRTSSGFDRNRLTLLLAVLEKRCGYQFSKYDVYVNVVGGFKLNDPSADLAIACALVSSYKDEAIASGTFFIGEVGLGGEVRMVPRLAQRIKEAEKLGLANGIVPLGGDDGKGHYEVSQMFGAIKKAFE